MLSKFRFITTTTSSPQLIASRRFFFSFWKKDKIATTPIEQKPIVVTSPPAPKIETPSQKQQQIIDDDDDPVSFLMNNQPPPQQQNEQGENRNQQPEGKSEGKQQQQQQDVNNNNNNNNKTVPPPQLHAVGVDPAEQLGQPGSVRLEVQITVMTGRMNAFEKKLDDHSTLLAKNEAEARILKMKLDSKETQQKEKEEIEKKLHTFEAEKAHSAKVIASSAAAWMSTALTLSSLLEAEEGHRAEMKIILQQILDKLQTKKEFKSLKMDKPQTSTTPSTATTLPRTKKQQEAIEQGLMNNEEEEDFFSTHEDSIRVATLVRLARVENELGNFQDALAASQKAIDEIIRCCPRHNNNENDEDDTTIETPTKLGKKNNNNNIDLVLICNSSIRYQWLLLCKLHATILAALNKTGQEQQFLKTKILQVSQLIGEWKILNPSGKIVETTNAAKSRQSNSSSASSIFVVAIIQEINLFVELLLRYADSLGLEEGGGGWKKPQDPVFVEKRNVCDHIVGTFTPVLGKVHPNILHARACFALDCGNVAVTRQETIDIMQSLIQDTEDFLKEKEIEESKDEEVAKKTGFTDVKGTTNEDLFALRNALLLWKRKLGLAYADLKQFDLSLKLLEETSAKCDQVLGVSHRDSLITLRCLVRVTFVSGNQEKAKLLNDKLVAREKPASI